MQFKDLPHADEKRNKNQKNTSSHSIGDMTKKSVMVLFKIHGHYLL